MDVHVHHEVPSKQTPTLLTVPVLVIIESLPIYSTVTLQSIPSFNPPPPQSTPTPPPITEAINPQSTLLDFTSVFQFNNRVTSLEKEVVELKKDDPLKTQVTSLVDENLDARLGATKDEFMNFLSIMVTESLYHAILAKESSQPRSSYETAASLTEFELKKILINKMNKSESYLAAPKHRECYEGLIKSYELDKTLFSTYDKSQSKSSGKSVQSEELEFEVADSDMPQDQEKNPSNMMKNPRENVTSKRDWFIKPKRPQKLIDPNWNDRKTPQQGPTQSWLMTLASSADKPLKTFDELMSTPIDFSAYIMNGLKITNLTQETLLGPSFRILKGTRTNYAEPITMRRSYSDFINLLEEIASLEMVVIVALVLYLKMGVIRLPYRHNLSKRGLVIELILCPSCKRHVESNNHVEVRVAGLLHEVLQLPRQCT
nr:hypothetical protein [Tanacetum cinerariifolium]